LPPELRKKSRAKVVAFVLPLLLVVVGGGFVYQQQMAARASKMERAPVTTVEPPPPPPTPAAEPPPPPTAAADPPASASASAKKPAASGGAAGAAPVLSADPTKTAVLDATPLPPGRKIVVDGRVVGTSPRRVNVRCGNHTVQIGDLPPENIHFPCGGEVSFTD